MKPLAVDVLVILPSLRCGGTEVQVLSMCRSLLRHGKSVMTASVFETDPSMTVLFKEAGIEVVEYGVERPHSPFKMCQAVLNVLRHLKSTVHPALLHLTYMTPGAAILAFAALLWGRHVPIVTTIHSLPAAGWSRALFRVQSRLLCKRTVFVSRHVLEQCVKTTPPPGWMVLENALPDHIPLKEFERRCSTLNPAILGFAGRLEPVKGTELLHQLLQQTGSNQNFKWRIAGDGSYRPILEKRADNAEMLGTINPTDMAAFYDSVDILAVPSVEEAFGLTVLEGMARGCVVVGTGAGGMAELLLKVSPHCIVSEPTPSAWINRINELARNPQLLQQLSKRSIEVASHYTASNYDLRITCLHQGILKQA